MDIWITGNIVTVLRSYLLSESPDNLLKVFVVTVYRQKVVRQTI